MFNMFLMRSFIKNLLAALAFFAFSLARLSANASWSAPTDIQQNLSVISPIICANQTGHAVSIWIQMGEGDVNGPTLWSSFYDGSIWNDAVQIFDAITGEACEPYLGFNDAGEALVVWRQAIQGGDAEFNVYYAFSSDGQEWSVDNQGPISPTLSNTQDVPNVFINASGNAIAIWKEREAQNQRIKTAYFDHTSLTWSLDGQLNYLCAPDMPQIALNASGEALAMWFNTQGELSYDKVPMSSFYNGRVWTTPEYLDLPNAIHGPCDCPEVYLNETGVGLCSYVYTTDPTLGVCASIYEKGRSKWTTITGLSDCLTPHSPSSTITNQGLCAVVWGNAFPQSPNPSLGSGAWASISTDLGRNWTTKKLSENVIGAIEVSLNEQGDAVVLWNESTLILGNHYTDGNWQPSPTQFSEYGFTNETQAVSAAATQAFVIWQNFYPYPRAIQAATLTYPKPATSITGKVINNCFVVHTYRMKTFSWAPSPTPSVTHYILYRNGKRIAKIDASSSLSYTEHNQEKELVTYSVCAADENGLSEAVSIIL